MANGLVLGLGQLLELVAFVTLHTSVSVDLILRAVGYD